MTLGASLVWAWLVLGLRLLSGGGAWQLGWFGSVLFATLLWPAFAIGYLNLRRVGFGPRRDDGMVDAAAPWTASTGVPVLLLGLLWSVVLLGLMRFFESFVGPHPSGVVNFVMSIVALHMFAWGGAGATQWLLASTGARPLKNNNKRD